MSMVLPPELEAYVKDLAVKAARFDAQKAQRRAYSRSYYQTHREERREYYQAHREDYRDRKRAERLAHSDRIRAYNRAYYQAHRGQLDAKSRARRAAARETILDTLIREAQEATARAMVTACASCGAQLERTGRRGRPRKFCVACHPSKVDNVTSSGGQS